MGTMRETVMLRLSSLFVFYVDGLFSIKITLKIIFIISEQRDALQRLTVGENSASICPHV